MIRPAIAISHLNCTIAIASIYQRFSGEIAIANNPLAWESFDLSL